MLRYFLPTIFMLLMTISFCQCEADRQVGPADSRKIDNNTSTDDTSSTDDLDNKGDHVSISTSQSSDEPNSTDDVCQEVDFVIEELPTRLMILQDISSSMNGEKWEQASAALKNALENWRLKGGIEFGFDVFPDNESCGVDKPVIVDTSTDTIDLIFKDIDNRFIKGSTPLCRAMRQFNPSLHSDYAPDFTSVDATSYLLVVSDGADGCSLCRDKLKPSPSLGQITDDLLKQGIKTFIIGFSHGGKVGGGWKSSLNEIAQAGGTPYDTFIDAQDSTTLENALNEIAEQAISCTYEIPASGDNVDKETAQIRFEGSSEALPLAKEGCQKVDNTMSWAWTDDTQTAVEFCYEACQMLREKDVSAKIGCEKTIVI